MKHSRNPKHAPACWALGLVTLWLGTAVALAAPVKQKTLANGLKVLVKQDQRAPIVVSQVWYKVGSSYEPNGLTGLSHMLEHMMFKGTETLAPGEFSRIIAEHGGQENAFTGRDYTAYFQTLEKSHLETSFKLEADRMRHLKLTKEELVKELEVVHEERRMRTEDNPNARLQEYFMATAFTNSPYKHPIIGWPADIQAYQVEDLKTWYQRWYAPNNATLVVAGDVDPAQVFQLAEQYFGPLKAEPVAPMKPQTEQPQLGRRFLELNIPAKLPYLLMGFKVPTLMTAEQDWEPYALEMLTAILDGGRSSRLTSRLVRGQQLAVSVGAGFNMHARLADLFMLEGVPAQAQTLKTLEEALWAEIRQLQTEPVSAAELARVKAQVVASDVYEQDSLFYQAMKLGMLETIGLDYSRADQYVQRIEQVTAEQVQAVASKYLTDTTVTVAYLQPQAMAAEATK
ncbi:MAG: pitrilysin family protein [Methylococcales bacterium]|nr:pitrilysin family protein [Methylococcales bacterium]